MNTDRRLSTDSHPQQAADNNAWTHALIWALLAVAALLLVGFTAVVNNIAERGELRRAQQRASGTFMALDELQAQDGNVVRLLSITGEKLAGR